MANPRFDRNFDVRPLAPTIGADNPMLIIGEPTTQQIGLALGSTLEQATNPNFNLNSIKCIESLLQHDPNITAAQAYEIVIKLNES